MAVIPTISTSTKMNIDHIWLYWGSYGDGIIKIQSLLSMTYVQSFQFNYSFEKSSSCSCQIH